MRIWQLCIVHLSSLFEWPRIPGGNFNGGRALRYLLRNGAEVVVRKVGSDSEQSVFTLNVLGMAKRSRLAVDTTLIGHVLAIAIACPLTVELRSLG